VKCLKTLQELVLHYLLVNTVVFKMIALSLMFNLETRKENMKLHTKVVNDINIISSNDFKLCSLKGDVIVPNNKFNE